MGRGQGRRREGPGPDRHPRRAETGGLHGPGRDGFGAEGFCGHCGLPGQGPGRRTRQSQGRSVEDADRPVQAGGRGPADLRQAEDGTGEGHGPGPRQNPRPADSSPGRAGAGERGRPRPGRRDRQMDAGNRHPGRRKQGRTETQVRVPRPVGRSQDAVDQGEENRRGPGIAHQALAMPKLTGDQIQEANLLLGVSWLKEKDFQKGIDCLKKAIEAAPKGPLVLPLRQISSGPKRTRKTRT